MGDPNYTPGPPSGGMTVDPNAKSNTWAIATIGTGGATKLIFGGSVVVLQLANATTGYSWPYLFIGGGLSLGLKGGVTISSPSWTVFTITDGLIGPDDFDSFGSMKSLGFTPIIGGSLTYGNIYSVNHDPNPLDLGGVSVGLSGGFDWTPGRFVLLASQGAPAQQLTASLDVDQVIADGADYVSTNALGSWVA
jgi:hypothetical protein